MTNWQPYMGEYEKEFYDIKTFDGHEFLRCWPNAGHFYVCYGQDKGVEILGEQVESFRPSQ